MTFAYEGSGRPTQRGTAATGPDPSIERSVKNACEFRRIDITMEDGTSGADVVTGEPQVHVCAFHRHGGRDGGFWYE